MGTNPSKACPPGNFEVTTYKIVTESGVSKGYFTDYTLFRASDSTLTSFTPLASTLSASISKLDSFTAS
jgi:hypothetical protein